MTATAWRSLLFFLFLALVQRASSQATPGDGGKEAAAGLPRNSYLSDEGDNSALGLLSASLCDPGLVPSDSLQCVEVAQAEELWNALANPRIHDIHIVQSIEMDTVDFSASRGAINRTSSVRLLGAGPGVSLHLKPIEQPPESQQHWLELRAWLRVEQFQTVSGLTSTFGSRGFPSTNVFPWAEFVGVRIPEVEQLEDNDKDFLIQGGYLTHHSGLLIMHSTLVVHYSVGNFFTASNTVKHWVRIGKGFRPLLQLFPAWPVPAVLLPRSLLYTESLIQEFRYVNASVTFEGNWPTQEFELATALPSPNDQCQTLNDGVDGRDYAGDISVALDGSHCLPWSSIRLSGLDFSGVEGNSCKNPADHFGVWCFTESSYPLDVNSMYVNADFSRDLDALLRQANGERFPYSWKYCDVPQCESETRDDCQLQEDLGDSYIGNVTVSQSGKPCQLWNQTSLYDLGRPHSFCRNPSGYAQSSLRPGGVWCWTDVQQGEWELCDVEFCREDDKYNVSSEPPSLDGVEPEEEAGAATSLAVIFGASAAAVVVILASAAAAYFTFKKRISQQPGTMYGILKPPQFLSYKSQNSATPEQDGSSGGYRGVRAGKSEASWPPGANRVLSSTITGQNDKVVAISRGDTAIGDTSVEELAIPEKMASILGSSPAELGYVQLGLQLGVGTFGKVWMCKWRPRDGVVVDAACKIVDMKGLQANLQTQLSESVEAVYMKSSMSHPHVVQAMQVYKVLAQQDAFSGGPGYSRPDDGLELWIIQELCNMGDLAAYNKASLQKPRKSKYFGVVLDILWEVMSALSFLHERGVVHADLKLDNILLQQDSNSAKGFVCKVGDFGVSHVMMDRDYYYSSSMSGEVRILAPEVLRSNKISKKMDTFSFGILMHDLYCPPILGWQRDSFPVVCTKTLTGERPEFPVDTHRAYQELAEACWSDDPAERPSDADVLSRLQSLFQLELESSSANSASTSAVP